MFQDYLLVSVIDGRSSGSFLSSFILFLTFTNKLYVTTSSEKGFRSISFLWPRTAFFVKLALYYTVKCPPKGELNSGESCFSLYQISLLNMNKLYLRFN